MPRTARKKSRSGIYHIMMRGINRQVIFNEKADNLKFIETMKKYREICRFELFAYCLMGNHVHLLIKENDEPLGIIMRRICSCYVLWYNKKYNRVGYLFQDRFKSEPVENEAYFKTVLRYILQNPVKAGLVVKASEYRWSNYSEYTGKNCRTDIKFALSCFHQEKEKAMTNFIDFVNMKNDDCCLELIETKQIADNEAISIIMNHCKIDYPQKIQELETIKRNAYLKELREKHGLSIRQIERLTGIGRGIIQKV